MVETLPGRSYSAADAAARGLGWLSLALGAAELLAPREVARATGLEGHEGLLRACGLREVMTGVGILSSHDATPFIWGRVGGDLLDLAILAPAIAEGGEKRRRAGAATAVVAGITLLDLVCAKALSDEKRLPQQPIKDYRDRSGLPYGPVGSRGLTALEARQGSEANRGPAA
ncbi:MAG TPA: cyclase dehydrase [Devosiaceae bacterium]|jgi:hypothetical protein|nr:cyclase dehydrase [Devosiaceae bacterium]